MFPDQDAPKLGERVVLDQGLQDQVLPFVLKVQPESDPLVHADLSFGPASPQWR
jgi:hypothetical protein